MELSKIPKQNLLNIHAAARSLKTQHPRLRLGQAFYMILRDQYPDHASALLGTDLDMFYNDGNIKKFTETYSYV